MAEGFIALFKPAGIHSTMMASRNELARGSKESLSLLGWIHGQPISEPWREALRRGWEKNNLEHGGMASAAPELGMLSRLDLSTSGIVVFAANPEAYKEAKTLQEHELLIKSYTFIASRRGTMAGGLVGSRPLECPQDLQSLLGQGGEIEIASRFRAFGPRGARVACLGAEEGTEKEKRAAPGIYRTSLRLLGSNKSAVLGEATIHRGFRHQIRAHLAWAGFPILGDTLYGGLGAERMYLEASSVELRRIGAPPDRKSVV